MLPQSNRLKQPDQIAEVFRRGKSFHSPFFSVKYLVNSENKSRLAFSFSKKHLILAVQRNRLKRMLIAELQKSATFFTLGVDTVFFLTGSVSLQDKKELAKSVEALLNKVAAGK